MLGILEDCRMINALLFDRSLLNVIREIEASEHVSFFVRFDCNDKDIAVLEAKHLSIKETYKVLKLVFKKPNYNNHSLYLEMLKIINEVLKKRLSNTDGYIKSMDSLIGSAVLIRSPYYEPFLDIRIAIARNANVIESAKDFIFYELGIDDLRTMQPTNEDRHAKSHL